MEQSHDKAKANWKADLDPCHHGVPIEAYCAPCSAHAIEEYLVTVKHFKPEQHPLAGGDAQYAEAGRSVIEALTLLRVATAREHRLARLAARARERGWFGG